MKNYSLKFFVVVMAIVGSIGATSSNVNAQFARNNLSRAQVDRLIRNVEERVDRFVVQFDYALDNSRLNNTRREDNLNQRARDLETATDELRREFDRNDSRRENSAEVRRVLNIASDINVAMRNRRLNQATERNWAVVRTELNALARAYNLPQLGGAYNQNTYNGQGNSNLSRARIDRLIRNVEQRVDRFVVQFDYALDNSRLNNTRRENRLNQLARDLEQATDELRREFDRNDSRRENSAEVRKCLNIASDIDVAMRNRRLNRATETNWVAVRTELNALAQAYNLSSVGGRYR
jgi:endo-alpha-1,4-polygalactosaminidase (GH114 family)